MAASFMSSCYQAEFRFAIEQTGIVRRIERAIFSAEPKADGNLRAVEEWAGEDDHSVHEVGLDTGAADGERVLSGRAPTGANKSERGYLTERERSLARSA